MGCVDSRRVAHAAAITNAAPQEWQLRLDTEAELHAAVQALRDEDGLLVTRRVLLKSYANCASGLDMLRCLVRFLGDGGTVADGVRLAQRLVAYKLMAPVEGCIPFQPTARLYHLCNSSCHHWVGTAAIGASLDALAELAHEAGLPADNNPYAWVHQCEPWLEKAACRHVVLSFVCAYSLETRTAVVLVAALDQEAGVLSLFCAETNSIGAGVAELRFLPLTGFPLVGACYWHKSCASHSLKLAEPLRRLLSELVVDGDHDGAALPGAVEAGAADHDHGDALFLVHIKSDVAHSSSLDLLFINSRVYKRWVALLELSRAVGLPPPEQPLPPRPPLATPTPPLSFADVMAVPQYRMHLLAYAGRNGLGNVVHFLQCIDGFKSTIHQDERLAQAHLVTSLFLTPGGEHPIEISSRAAQQLSPHIFQTGDEQTSPDSSFGELGTFDACVLDVHVQLEAQLWARYVGDGRVAELANPANAETLLLDTAQSIFCPAVPCIEDVAFLQDVMLVLTQFPVLQDVKQRFKRIPYAARGCDIVDWLVLHSYSPNRPAAVALGHRLLLARLLAPCRPVRAFSDSDALFAAVRPQDEVSGDPPSPPSALFEERVKGLSSISSPLERLVEISTMPVPQSALTLHKRHDVDVSPDGQLVSCSALVHRNMCTAVLGVGSRVMYVFRAGEDHAFEAVDLEDVTPVLVWSSYAGVVYVVLVPLHYQPRYYHEIMTIRIESSTVGMAFLRSLQSLCDLNPQAVGTVTDAVLALHYANFELEVNQDFERCTHDLDAALRAQQAEHSSRSDWSPWTLPRPHPRNVSMFALDAQTDEPEPIHISHKPGSPKHPLVFEPRVLTETTTDSSLATATGTNSSIDTLGILRGTSTESLRESTVQ